MTSFKKALKDYVFVTVLFNYYASEVPYFLVQCRTFLLFNYRPKLQCPLVCAVTSSLSFILLS